MKSSVVYFLHQGTSIKIGYTTNLDARIKALAVGSVGPMTVLATIHGGTREEKAVHRALREHRLNGEWFSDCSKVRKAIDEYVRHGVPASAIPAKPRRTDSQSPSSDVAKEMIRALLDAEKLRLDSKTKAHESVGEMLQVSSSWIRKYLAYDHKVAEPRVSLFAKISDVYRSTTGREPGNHSG